MSSVVVYYFQHLLLQVKAGVAHTQILSRFLGLVLVRLGMALKTRSYYVVLKTWTRQLVETHIV